MHAFLVFSRNYLLVLGIYSVLTSPDQRRIPFLVNSFLDRHVADRIAATLAQQVRLWNSSSDRPMFR